MNQKLLAGIIFILCLSVLSCNSEEPDGKWDDNIKLSEKEVTIGAESNTIVISTGGTSWWVSDLGFNGDWSYNVLGIDTTQDNFLIQENEFTIERINGNEIHIYIAENESSIERILIIGLQSGNYFDGIKIIQTGK